MKALLGIALVSLSLQAALSTVGGHSYQVEPATRSGSSNGGPAGQPPCGNDNGLFVAGEYKQEAQINGKLEVEWNRGHAGTGGDVSWYLHLTPGDPPVSDPKDPNYTYTGSFVEIGRTDYDAPSTKASYDIPPFAPPNSIVTLSYKWDKHTLNQATYQSCTEIKLLPPDNPEVEFTPEACGGDLKSCSEHGKCRFDPQAEADANPMYCECEAGWGGMDCSEEVVITPAGAVAIGAGVLATAGAAVFYTRRRGMMAVYGQGPLTRYNNYSSGKSSSKGSTSRSGNGAVVAGRSSKGSKGSRGSVNRRSVSSNGAKSAMTAVSDFTRGADPAEAYTSNRSSKSRGSRGSKTSKTSKNSRRSKGSRHGKSGSLMH